MVARRNGRNPPSSIAPSADGAILGKAEGRRPHPVSGWRMAALCRTVPDHEPPTILNVGAGIPDGPGRNAPWTRQGCRVLRTGYTFATMRRSTSPGTARRHTQVLHYEYGGHSRRAGARTSSLCCRWMPPRRPPPTDGVGTAAFGFAGGCAICGWRFGTTGCFARCGGRAFRWLRPAGISPVATGDQRRCLWTPRFFEKNE